jgi:anaerobic magnesium-protoporphyrin IX monomethyl ester cyclase
MKLVMINPAVLESGVFRNSYNDKLKWIKSGNRAVVPFEPPIGLAGLVAWLKGKGYDASLLDMQGLGLDEQQLRVYLMANRPDVVGITAMTPTFPSALKVVSIVKSSLPGARVVLGGVHPSVEPASALADEAVDFVVRGEGEHAVASLLDALGSGSSLDGIEGLCYRAGGDIVIREKARSFLDLDALPLPDYDSFPLETYIDHLKNLCGFEGERGVTMLVSRGCPYSCAFCAVRETMGRNWRIKSPKRVVDEIEFLRKKYNLTSIWFKDSILNVNKKWTQEFCSEILTRGICIEWHCNTRVEMVVEEELKLMKNAGLAQIDIGIESGSPRSRKVLSKNYSNEQIEKAVGVARKYVKVFGYFMIGIPGETEEDIAMTFNMARELKLDRVSWYIYNPLPGSELYDKLIEEGKITDGDMDHNAIQYGKNNFELSRVPKSRLEDIYRQINEYFYKGIEPTFDGELARLISVSERRPGNEDTGLQ